MATESEVRQRQASQGAGPQEADAGNGAGQQRAPGGNETLLPALANLQRRLVEAVRSPGDVHSGDEPRAESPEGRPDKAAETGASAGGLTLSIGKQEIERALSGVLSATLDAIFSDDLRGAVHEQTGHALDSLVTSSRRRVPSAAMKEARERASQISDDMVEQLFSDSLRNEAQKNGERAIQALSRVDGPAARREEKRALQALVTARLDVIQSHWQQIAQTFVDAAVKQPSKKPQTQAKKEQPKEQSEGDSNEPPMPQAVAHSAKQVQTTWTRAYERAAKEHGAGRKAERAATDALRRQFERRGDHWVRKPKGE